MNKIAEQNSLHTLMDSTQTFLDTLIFRKKHEMIAKKFEVF